MHFRFPQHVRTLVEGHPATGDSLQPGYNPHILQLASLTHASIACTGARGEFRSSSCQWVGVGRGGTGCSGSGSRFAEAVLFDSQDDGGDVVLGSAVLGGFDDLFGDLLWVEFVGEQSSECQVIDSIGDPIGAEQDDIAWCGFEDNRRSAFAALLGSEVAIQNIAVSVCECFFGADGLCVDECLRQGVVGGELFEVPVSEPVDSAVADASGVEFSFDVDDEDERGAHVVEAGFELSQRDDFGVDECDDSIECFDNGVVRVLFEVELFDELFADQFDRHFAGLFTGRLSAHAVGDEEEAVLGIDGQSILIVAPEISGNAQAADLDPYHVACRRWVLGW